MVPPLLAQRCAKANGRPCHKPTSNVCPTGIADGQKVGRLLNGRLWSTKLPKQHVRFQVAAEGHFMTATREFRKRARNAS
jgi:hypothetical protein